MTHRSPDMQAQRFNAASWAWLALLVLALSIYALGLGGQYNPSNGDELVYTHIARLTAASNHWLPLVSDLDHMRNTKPPLLFWQAMVAGDWGQHWTMAALRMPSLIYTLLITGALAWVAYLITCDFRRACLAACIYLAFFSTFRYGRTFLTSAPETFWLNLPMFYLLWQRWRNLRHEELGKIVISGSPSWLAHVGFGLALGLGLAYKSFALIAPAATALWCAQILSASGLNWRAALRTTGKVSLSVAIALAIFSLWFVLDPDPQAVWQEFVIGENVGKLSNDQGYWQVALFGGGASIWAQLLAYVQNAGLLALVVLGLVWVGLKFGVQAWRQRRDNPGPTTEEELARGGRIDTKLLIILLVWLAVWLIVFTLPSQRSARYVIPAMPALAMLLALYWSRIARGWFLSSLLLCGVSISVFGRIAWAAHELGIGTDMELIVTLLAVALGLGLIVGASLKPAWTRACTLAACLATLACFSLTTAPLNGAAGQYSEQTVAELLAKKIAVPNGFNSQFERFQFLLPGNQFVPYAGEARKPNQTDSDTLELSHLLATFDAVVWLQAELSEVAPPCLPTCTLLGTRWEVKGRHRSGEITLANLWYPQRWLFRREWLVTGAV
jgi:4-amino-4-deoxy-L-arabinose transferase-like glycosyltransferase